MLPVIEFMSLLFADARAERSDYLAWVDASIRDFQPNVIHVYNFVGASYQLLRLREKYPLLRIVRTVTHTEDVCFSTDPLMLNARGTIERCTGPFPIDRCVQHFLQSGVSVEGDVRECIVDHYRQLNTYYQKYIDGVIFSGDLFRGFMMKIFALPRNCWVVPYGVEPVIAKNVSVLTGRFFTRKIFWRIWPSQRNRCIAAGTPSPAGNPAVDSRDGYRDYSANERFFKIAGTSKAISNQDRDSRAFRRRGDGPGYA